MTGIHPLHPDRHGALRYERNAAGTARRLVQLGLSEIALAAADMPLCLAKDAGTGEFNLVALLGLVEPTSLFAADGRIHATYWPRAAGLSCFRLDDRGTAGLAVDTQDPAIGPATGIQLFENGAPAPFLDGIRDALHALIADIGAARRLIDAYATRRLLRPLGLVLREANGHEHCLDGLYTFDTEAIRDLPDADVIALHRMDGLATAGVLTGSLAQLERLRQLHNARYPRQILSADIGVAA